MITGLRIRELTADASHLGTHQLKGWVKTHRRSKNISFIELTDGSSVKGLQLVIEPGLESYAACANDVSTGAAIEVEGELIESPAKGQAVEFQVKRFDLVGSADETYPLQKKGHTLEFLREILHLRSRSNTLGAVFRIRSRAAMAVHEFFQSRGFLYVHTPIITTSDCEGAGEMFRVTTLDLQNVPRTDKGEVDFQQDFFKDEASLTVSGQLEAEVFALSHSNCYTFGPTFRSENSNTSRHLSEFWMIEPEMAFCDLEGDMALGGEFVQSVIADVLKHCADDLDFLQARDWVDYDLLGTLNGVVNSDCAVMDYSEAIQVLEKSGETFEFPVSWGMDLQAEHERYLTDQHVKGPVFVINYPKDIKAFYMRQNDDGKTVAAMDLLVPRLGEIIGGSQREERGDLLADRMKQMEISTEDYQWYLELRKFGSVPHAGFGLGFERLLMYLTGMQNIRDVIPMPRHPGYAKF